MSITLFGKRPWSPAAFGASLLSWLDPADLSALRQDYLGATPVIGLEQPVGLALDKSGRGNHGATALATARPELSARHNLAYASHDFSSAYWITNQGAGSSNFGVSPDGSQNSYLITDGTKYIPLYDLPVNHPITISEYIRPVTQGSVALYKDSGTQVVQALFDPMIKIFSSLSTPVIGTGFEECEDGWLRIWCTYLNNTDTYGTFHLFSYGVSTEFYGFQVVSGDKPGRYQRVDNPLQYDSAGFLPFLMFGADDEMATVFPQAPGSECTVAYAVPGIGAEISTGRIIGAEFVDAKSHAGRIIVDRGLTARETTYLARYLNQKAGVMP